MPYPTASHALCFLASWLVAILPARGEATAPTDPDRARSTVQLPVVPESQTVSLLIECAELETTAPKLLGEKLSVLPAGEAESLLKRLVQAAHAKVKKPRLATLETGETTTVGVTEELSDPSSKQTSAIKITVGGVEQEFTARIVGVKLELQLQETSPDHVAIDLTLKQTCLMGFVEYGGQQVELQSNAGGGKPTTVTLPTGFLQPVFDTSSRDEKLILRKGHVAVLREDPLASKEKPSPEKATQALIDAVDSKPTKPLLIFVRLAPQS